MSELIKASEVAELLGVSRRTVFRYEKNDPKFPRKISLKSNVTRFRASEVHSYIEALNV